MPGLYEQTPETAKNKRVVCNCNSCACQTFKRTPGIKKAVPPNGIVFQLPRHKEPKSDTYSHTVYRKEMCNRLLMKQHALLAQRKVSQRKKQAPIFQQEKFVNKSTTDSEFRRYTTKEVAACKTKFPRPKRKEDFYFKPGEYNCDVKFLLQPLSHEDYCPKVPIPSTYRKIVKECDIPPFEGISCYDRDFRPPPMEAYSMNRKPRKRVLFD